MADNIIVPPQGTGTTEPTIATDNVTDVHYQKVKLVDGTAGSAALIHGDATNGLDVDVTRMAALVAGSADIGGVKLVDENGTLFGVKQSDNQIIVTAQPYGYAMVEGDLTGHVPFHKLGYNPDIDNAEEDLWEQGGTYVWPDAGGVDVEVVSDNTNDTLAGTGAQKVKVSFLKADYTSGSQTINMNGTGAVELTEQNILRVQSIRVVQAGSGGVAAGNIHVRDVTTPSRIYRNIVAGYTRGRSLIYTVPAEKTMYITSVWLAASAGSYTRFTLRANYDDADLAVLPVGLFQPIWGATVGPNACSMVFPIPLKVPATCDLKMSAISSASNSNSVAHCVIDGWTE